MLDAFDGIGIDLTHILHRHKYMHQIVPLKKETTSLRVLYTEILPGGGGGGGGGGGEVWGMKNKRGVRSSMVSCDAQGGKKDTSPPPPPPPNPESANDLMLDAHTQGHKEELAANCLTWGWLGGHLAVCVHFMGTLRPFPAFFRHKYYQQLACIISLI